MPRYKFSGHETFPLRYSWLPKGLRALDDDWEIFFKKDEAMVELGVGKNMVRAIRHWCTATGMAEVDGRSDVGRVTDLGRRLFLGTDENKAWDPFLEDPGTLWLLHWMLASRSQSASTWYLAFTEWGAEVFTKEDLINWLHGILEDLEKSRATRNSLERDVRVFLRTYVPSEPTRHRPAEDTFDSPLVELGLIREQEEGDVYRFVRGEKESLPPEIFAAALLDYWKDEEQTDGEGGGAAIGFERLLYGRGSPGSAFKFNERALATRLERLPDWTGLSFDETAGLRTVYRTGDEVAGPMESLVRYYREKASEVAA